MSTEHTDDLAFDEIVDHCIDEIAAGRLTTEEALARWPDHRDELAPILELALAVRELPAVPERALDPERRAAFMEQIATAAQDSPTRERTGAGGWFAGLGRAFPRVTAIAASAAVIALLAVFVVLSNGGSPATASTLTVFDGVVERQADRGWLAVADGTALNAGDRIRTTNEGRALLTFRDGSTAALDPGTELVIEHATDDRNGQITIEQVQGRLWNDVAPGREPATYVVRTADATVEAHGTTFETSVASGETAVVTAAGVVEVAAGDARVTVEPGQMLRAAAQRILDGVRQHPTSSAPALLRIDGPFVASLSSQNGAATGALPNGVTYEQIPGVSTSNPGNGPQLLRFFDIAPGRYTLIVRRIDGPPEDGQIALETAGQTQIVPLPNDLSAMRVRVDISVDGGSVALRLVDSIPITQDTGSLVERIVDSPRTADAVAVADQRAATVRQPLPTDDGDDDVAASPTPTASSRPATSPTPVTSPTPTASPRPSASPTPAVSPTPSATPTATATPVASPTATASPTSTPRPTGDLTLRQRLTVVLALDAPDRSTELRRLLESFGRDETAWANLRGLLDGAAALRTAFIEALVEIDAPIFVTFVVEQLGLDGLTIGDGLANIRIASRIEGTVTPTEEPAPAEEPATATPEGG